MFPLKRLAESRRWKRIFYERLTEPLHLNLLSILALSGGFRLRQEFDLVLRFPNAFGMLKAANWARTMGIMRIAALEFGVANGAGLVNMCEFAKKVEEDTGVECESFGI